MTTEIRACPSCGIDLNSDVDNDPALVGETGPLCRACGQGMFFRVELAGPVRVMHLQGQGLVTEQNVMRGLERVRYLISDPDCNRILIDFRGVNYLSSTILARLINLAKLAKESNATLKLSRIIPDVQDIFRIARLEGFFERYPDIESALSAF